MLQLKMTQTYRKEVIVLKGSIFHWMMVGGWVRPWSLTWNLKMALWKRRSLLATIIFRFYVKLWGCIYCELYDPVNDALISSFQWLKFASFQKSWFSRRGWLVCWVCFFPSDWIGMIQHVSSSLSRLLSGSTIRTLLHGKINPKDWQVASPLVM